MTAANLDHTNLNAAKFGGLVNEDVMAQLFRLDGYPLPFTDLIGKGRSGNQYKSFTIDEYGAPATDNAEIDGADLSQNDASIGQRAGNYHQTSVKMIQISKRANAVNSIASQGTVSSQLNKVQTQLKRDMEAQMLTGQASVAGDGVSVAGVSAGLAAWITTNFKSMTDGAAGGFNYDTGLIAAQTVGTTAAALTEDAVRDVAQGVYTSGEEPTVMMCVPDIARAFSEYSYSAGARMATMTNDKMGENTGRANTAYSATSVWVTDFGNILTITPNRLQQNIGTNISNVFILTPKLIMQSFITNVTAERMAKTGLSEKWMVSADYTLLVMNEAAQGVIADVDNTAAMTAS